MYDHGTAYHHNVNDDHDINDDYLADGHDCWYDTKINCTCTRRNFGSDNLADDDWSSDNSHEHVEKNHPQRHDLLCRYDVRYHSDDRQYPRLDLCIHCCLCFCLRYCADGIYNSGFDTGHVFSVHAFIDDDFCEHWCEHS